MINALKRITDEKNIHLSEPMSKHTTFKLGGEADIYITPTSSDELINIISVLKEHGIKYMIIGNGSNLLVSDKGIEGAVVSTEKLTSISVSGNSITADAGVKLSALASESSKNSLAGLEFAGGIPGTVGGAVFMNAGAYENEIKNVILSVTALIDGNVVTLKNEECEFGYRKSIFQNNNSVILSAQFSLAEGNKDDILFKMHNYATRRKEKQPLELPSAGSVFKRPQGHFAGKLIEDSGLRGFSIGGAQVSEKHCGFIVNKGGATASDVLTLIKHIKTVVYVRFGVKLCEEIKFIGRR